MITKHSINYSDRVKFLEASCLLLLLLSLLKFWDENHLTGEYKMLCSDGTFALKMMFACNGSFHFNIHIHIHLFLSDDSDKCLFWCTLIWFLAYISQMTHWLYVNHLIQLYSISLTC